MASRGEIWLANLNPPHGTEPGKTRPVFIVQAQALLDAGHPSTVIIPMTTNLLEDAEPLRVRVPVSGQLREPSDLLVHQLRAIDNRRLAQGPLAQLSPVIMSQVNEALREVLDLDDEPPGSIADTRRVTGDGGSGSA
ncbi:MAG TPA: type II toxin-antitoxin system PemK/MazF family toxin [Dehalococcoidia bacterium]|nr:type II toxin-antitoxin system PemK/MazF family toxin [Dehalococcoidia bacterium]